MFKDTIMSFLDNKIKSDFTIQLIDAIYTPIITLLILFLSYHLLKFTYYKIRDTRYHKKLASSGIRDIDKMDGLQFEFYLKALLKELGYKSEVTKGSNDFGADLIMKKDNKKIVIQAKRYKYKSNVSIDAVQQVYTAITYYKANEAWIITNSFYTKNAQKLAKVCNVELLDRYKLIDFINDVNPSIKPEKVRQTVTPKERKCPQCDGDLIARHSKTGNIFMGCSDFSDCKHTEPVAKTSGCLSCGLFLTAIE